MRARVEKSGFRGPAQVGILTLLGLPLLPTLTLAGALLSDIADSNVSPSPAPSYQHSQARLLQALHGSHCPQKKALFLSQELPQPSLKAVDGSLQKAGWFPSHAFPS